MYEPRVISINGQEPAYGGRLLPQYKQQPPPPAPQPLSFIDQAKFLIARCRQVRNELFHVQSPSDLYR